MAFAVLLHQKATKELGKLEKDLRTRIKERLKELKNNPQSIGKALKPSEFWSLRIGDYRAIFEIDRAKKQVMVLFIEHGKKVYDDFSKML